MQLQYSMANRQLLPSPSATALKPAAPAREARRRVERVMRTLARATEGLDLPAVETTLAASTRLFAKAPTAEALARLPVKQIEKLIYPVSFYRNKAVFVRDAARMIITKFGGTVPPTLDEMMMLPGVGRKTANLVMILAFKSAENICVDIHVHRIANRLGWVRTRTPEETEQALYKALDRQWWPIVNLYLVTWGQNMCRPVYPRCSDCALLEVCDRVDVTRVGKPTFAKAPVGKGVM
jgi:endonuclease-3